GRSHTRTSTLMRDSGGRIAVAKDAVNLIDRQRAIVSRTRGERITFRLAVPVDLSPVDPEDVPSDGRRAVTEEVGIERRDELGTDKMLRGFVDLVSDESPPPQLVHPGDQSLGRRQ